MSRCRALPLVVALAATLGAALGQGDEPPEPDAVPTSGIALPRRRSAHGIHGIDAVRSGGSTGIEAELATERARAPAAATSDPALGTSDDEEPPKAAAAVTASPPQLASSDYDLSLLQEAGTQEVSPGPHLAASFQIAGRTSDFDRIRFWGKLSDYLQIRAERIDVRAGPSSGPTASTGLQVRARISLFDSAGT